MTRTTIIEELHRSLHQLAHEVEDLPGMAGTLRRFAQELPTKAAPPHAFVPRRRCPSVRPLLYAALDSGSIDWRSFNRLMLASRRAERSLVAQAAH